MHSNSSQIIVTPYVQIVTLRAGTGTGAEAALRNAWGGGGYAPQCPSVSVCLNFPKQGLGEGGVVLFSLREGGPCSSVHLSFCLSKFSHVSVCLNCPDPNPIGHVTKFGKL